MLEKIIIKDVSKERVVYVKGDGYSESKAIDLVSKVLMWLLEKEISISDLPLAVVSEDRDFELCVPIKEASIEEENEFRIKIIPAHRMGLFFHKESNKPLSISEQFLERQLRYQGFKLLWPRRYIFHQNPEKPEVPIVEIQIPVHK
jgi:DNA gyrase inhibitor GyrI